ncbi:MAG: SUMF1/EgtB/PvdO family nonheme iron enzyme [Bacteroidota bacterium]|nr:SUMF1/EgtB/PvdO family nonheme iron enzyme [Bacteroidota bacterium]
MKRFFILSLFLLFCFSKYTLANNLTVTSPVLVGPNASSDYVNVKFDISWDNSWRTSSAPNNWDAAWVFVKFKVGSGEWQHATISSIGHTAPSGGTITPSSDTTGVFIYRDANGTGSVNFQNVLLRWNYGANGVSDNAQVTVKVFGIEMVHVPQDSFYVGSGGTEPGSLTNGSWTSGISIPLKITSESALTVGQSSGNIWTIGNGAVDGSVGSSGSISASFPKGFQAFYCMKYSVSQEQYRDFLNMLTYTQQASRTTNAPNSGSGTFAMPPSTDHGRNGIRIQTNGVSTTTPAVYACDASEDAGMNESNDGQTLSCSWLSWGDGIAFSDWTGLRPISELEFEKACRGPSSAVAGEYAWGNASATAATATTNNRQVNETVSAPSGANVNYNDVPLYPIRVGIFATASSTRPQAGASYYGIMDMSGDLWERVVSINDAGRGFSGSHGNGVLDSNGDETGNSDWPGTGASGAGFRGGTWDGPYINISNRYIGTLTSSTRGDKGTRGFRSVRTAP